MINKKLYSLLLLMTLVFVFACANIFAQQPIKPAIDFETYKKWPSIRGVQLSKDGKYILFRIEKGSPFFQSAEESKKVIYVIKAVDNGWERKYIGLQASAFTADSRYASLTKADGSTLFLDLEHSKELKNIYPPKQAVSVKPITDIQWNAVHTSISITRNGLKDSIADIVDYLVPADKSSLVLSGKDAVTGRYVLHWYNLESKKKKLLFESKPGEKIELNHINANPILFKVVLPFDSVNSKFTSVDVWGYKDPSAPMPFAERKQELKSWQYAINSEIGKAVLLAGLNEQLLAAKADYALIENRLGKGYSEFSWNEKSRACYYLVSLKDGSRKLIHKQGSKGLMEARLSPDGKYVVFNDYGLLKYQAYHTKSGKLVDLNHGIEITVTTIDLKSKYLAGDSYWLNDDAVVVKDDYDLWKLDLTGKKPPLNLTAGFGRKNEISFWVNKTFHSSTYLADTYLQENELKGYLLNAFDHKDKSWGFYKLKDLSGKGLQKLSSGTYYYGGDNPVIVKAEHGKTFVVTRGTAAEFPNLFTTRDFKTFTQLSNVQPQKDYNWLTSELLRWKTDNNEFRDGILYKPENFNPSKKYPVVVHIYNEFTSGLNKYPAVRQDLNTLDIPWLVSNGYLVFIPDLIYRTPGRRLKSGYDMLIPGIKYLSSLPYVDSGKIGLQGASWGGEQTGYMVTHTNLFAAAFMGAGFSERISASGYSDVVAQRNFLTNNIAHFGGLLTEVPDLYRDEAALFSANLLTTPLLIKHNKDDDAVPFYQGLQFFQALRALSKKVWMLQYEKGGHGVRPGKDNEDMCLRISQFFDHYLKDKPAPKWMTQGILPEYKQVESGLELDTSGAIP